LFSLVRPVVFQMERSPYGSLLAQVDYGAGHTEVIRLVSQQGTLCG